MALRVWIIAAIAALIILGGLVYFHPFNFNPAINPIPQTEKIELKSFQPYQESIQLIDEPQLKVTKTASLNQQRYLDTIVINNDSNEELTFVYFVPKELAENAKDVYLFADNVKVEIEKASIVQVTKSRQ